MYAPRIDFQSSMEDILLDKRQKQYLRYPLPPICLLFRGVRQLLVVHSPKNSLFIDLKKSRHLSSRMQLWHNMFFLQPRADLCTFMLSQ